MKTLYLFGLILALSGCAVVPVGPYYGYNPYSAPSVMLYPVQTLPAAPYPMDNTPIVTQTVNVSR